MQYRDVPDIGLYLTEYSEDLAILRQQRLMNESQFLTFTKDRGLPVSGVNTGDPGRFHRLGWLYADGVDSEGRQRFHPFRLYPMHHILGACELRVARSASLNAASALRMLQAEIGHVPSADRLGELAGDWNSVASLAVLLDPIYWPIIVGSRRFSASIREDDFQKRLDAYQTRILELVGSLDPGFWQNVHECLRIEAARIDSNSELYLLLRVSAWDARMRLKGQVSAALWIRHMAEVIRRAFENVHGQCWPEEDRAFGYWPAGTRELAYGAERPCDDVLAAKPFLAHAFGLFTGSTVRWYLEGDTEFFAVLEIFPDTSRFGVELINLKGEIASRKGNVPLKLEALLHEDRSMRRFSALSFDRDLAPNVEYVRRQVKRERIVGGVTIHDPDFEFANFDLGELVEIAAALDESNGFSGDPVRQADWTGVLNARTFEERYRQVSASKAPGLKGEAWGRALGRYAIEHHDRQDGKLRPLWADIRAAVQAWSCDYSLQLNTFTFDHQTFELVRKSK